MKLEAERQYKLRTNQVWGQFGSNATVLELQCLDYSWITFLFSSCRSVTGSYPQAGSIEIA